MTSSPARVTSITVHYTSSSVLALVATDANGTASVVDFSDPNTGPAISCQLQQHEAELKLPHAPLLSVLDQKQVTVGLSDGDDFVEVCTAYVPTRRPASSPAPPLQGWLDCYRVISIAFRTSTDKEFGPYGGAAPSPFAKVWDRPSPTLGSNGSKALGGFQYNRASRRVVPVWVDAGTDVDTARPAAVYGVTRKTKLRLGRSKPTGTRAPAAGPAQQANSTPQPQFTVGSSANAAAGTHSPRPSHARVRSPSKFAWPATAQQPQTAHSSADAAAAAAAAAAPAGSPHSSSLFANAVAEAAAAAAAAADRLQGVDVPGCLADTLSCKREVCSALHELQQHVDEAIRRMQADIAGPDNPEASVVSKPLCSENQALLRRHCLDIIDVAVAAQRTPCFCSHWYYCQCHPCALAAACATVLCRSHCASSLDSWLVQICLPHTLALLDSTSYQHMHACARHLSCYMLSCAVGCAVGCAQGLVSSSSCSAQVAACLDAVKLQSKVAGLLQSAQQQEEKAASTAVGNTESSCCGSLSKFSFCSVPWGHL